MKTPRRSLPASLPVEEAAQIIAEAASKGVATEEYLGIQVLRSTHGANHVDVVAFDRRTKQSQPVPVSPKKAE